MRYVTSRMFSGAILFEGNKALLINCAEVYGRQNTTDAHCGRVIVNNEDNLTKLEIGTRVSNLLVTSSVLLGVYSVAYLLLGINGTLKSHDTHPINPHIFLDAENVKEAKKLFDEGTECWRLRPHDVLAQLRQERSKVHRQSTYTLCRASLELTDLHTYRPYTIWTLDNAGSSVPVESQEKHASRLFQIIALAVIRDGREATLLKSDVQQIIQNCHSGNVLR
ncbi:hypothetical protein VTP01DRAFT_4953 [Rhizomucor pusillus]|uniref:uncharacterized protein n=1 Tax=Rhizomucor pusillus TaxID=4840 RepID=UPI003744433A